MKLDRDNNRASHSGLLLSVCRVCIFSSFSFLSSGDPPLRAKLGGLVLHHLYSWYCVLFVAIDASFLLVAFSRLGHHGILHAIVCHDDLCI